MLTVISTRSMNLGFDSTSVADEDSSSSSLYVCVGSYMFGNEDIFMLYEPNINISYEKY
jgi:hypothetical protein